MPKLPNYYGIKKGYPRIQQYFGKLVGYVVLSRPFTLLLPLIGGWLLIQGSLRFPIFTPNPFKTWSALLVLVLINAGGNLLNAAYDVEIDKINKPYRPTCTGTITREEASRAALGFLSAAYFLSIFVNDLFFLICMSIIALTCIYSVPPFRFKKIFVLNNLTQAVIRGFLGVLAAWIIYGEIGSKVMGMGIILTSFIVSAQTSKDISDLAGDAAYNIKTFPVVIGIKKTQKLMTYLAPIPFAFLIFFVFYGVFSAAALLGLLLLPFALWIPRTISPKTQFENCFGWILFYVLMLLFLLIFVST